MTGEISLDDNKMVEGIGGELGFLGDLENRIDSLLARYQEMVRERDTMAASLESEREKNRQLEKRMELFVQERENVRTRIDQLLHRLKGIDV
jgi:hypothetical protein